jgi:glycosyltransferase involved in cell wall biosynthesis
MKSRLLRPVLAGLARWDAATAGRVDTFLANSQYVARRIRRYYNRGSTVVYPPIDTTFYHPDPVAGAVQPTANVVVVSALVPYKRVDRAIEACRIAGVPLKIVGRGPELPRLRQLAGPDCEFLGWRSDEEVRELYRSATAVLLPGIEDFGIVPVETQACGRPVVALGAGGACESVLDGETGILVHDPTPEAFADAIARVQKIEFDPDVVRANAIRFSRARFQASFTAAVDAARRDNAPSDPRDRSRLTKSSDRCNPAAREEAARDARGQSRLTKSSDRYNAAAREDKQ